MKTLKYKAYCVIEITDDTKQIPTLHKSKAEAIRYSTSYHGHPCDDPEKRGVVAECEVIVKLPAMPAVTTELREYVEMFCGRPGLIQIGNERWNNHARKLAKAEQRRKLRKLRHVA